MLHQNYESYTYVPPQKNWVDWISSENEKKCNNLKNVNFEKKVSKAKNHTIFTFDAYFHNFVVKIETSCVHEVLLLTHESILERRNASDLSMHMVYSL